MPTRLDEVLAGRAANYILPLVWQRGEPEPVIRAELARIHEAGIGAICVEARPHPGFAGPLWWRDMDVIMDEARRRGMRVWIFDDDHFPTGHAAGRVAEAPPALRRMFLKERHIDAIGPQPGAAFPLAPWRMRLVPPLGLAPVEASLVAAVAARRDPAGDTLLGELLDLTALVQGDVLRWDVPEGIWRVFLLFASPEGGVEELHSYVNPIVGESVRLLIDAVYEPFYQRYAGDFGGTLAGFFSDEPGFYNDPNIFNYRSTLGAPGVDLPWRPDLLELIEARLGAGCRRLLPLLWFAGGEATPAVRHAFMDVLSRLYAEHFSGQLGAWCREHGVEYIGHVIEDNGAHARLGNGAGHFFRALWAQDMAGIDVVLWQLVPGFDAGPFAGPFGDWDGEFFHYGLAKLASSLAHIDPKKRGRALCELFGAYGWREGLKLMKWMTDHLLVRGINHFMPHAFSQAEFPDADCPPHLYARGKNPQYRFYRALNQYTNRISHLLAGGRHVASAAVLYHAEAEWSGEAMPFHIPVRALLQRQIDCDVLPGDMLLEGATVAGGALRVAEETYGCLVVPACAALPAALLARLARLAEQGLPLVFVERLPARASEGGDPAGALARLAAHPGVCVVPLAGLAGALRELGCYELTAAGEQPALRHYHVAYPELDVFLLCNEHPLQAVDTTVYLPVRGPLLAYDAFANAVARLSAGAEGEGTRLALRLSPYESLVVLAGAGIHALAEGAPAAVSLGARAHVIAGPWALARASAEQHPAFEPAGALAELRDMSLPDALPGFSGTLRYEARFAWAVGGAAATLDLGAAYEVAEVWVNGQHAGLRICPPYRFEVGALLRAGANTLVVEVTNTLGTEQRDFFSRFAQHEPSGLLGPVRLFYSDEQSD